MIASEASETAGPSTFDARPKGKKTLMRRLKIISGIVVTLVVGWFIFATVMIYIPPQGDVEARTDAVVSLSPPPYRLPLAEELYANDRAPRLAISYVPVDPRSEEHTSELQSRGQLVCRLLLEKRNRTYIYQNGNRNK